MGRLPASRPLPPDALVEIGLVLRLADRDRVDAYLAGLGIPASPDYRRFLDPAGFGRRFGAPDDAVERVVGWARSAGLEVIGIDARRTVVRIRASAARLERLFDVALRQRIDPDGTATLQPDRPPSLPEPLRADVTTVIGLAGIPPPRPVQEPTPAGDAGPADAARRRSAVPMASMRCTRVACAARARRSPSSPSPPS